MRHTKAVACTSLSFLPSLVAFCSLQEFEGFAFRRKHFPLKPDFWNQCALMEGTLAWESERHGLKLFLEPLALGLWLGLSSVKCGQCRKEQGCFRTVRLPGTTVGSGAACTSFLFLRSRRNFFLCPVILGVCRT